MSPCHKVLTLFPAMLKTNLPGLPPENSYTDTVQAIPMRAYEVKVQGGP